MKRRRLLLIYARVKFISYCGFTHDTKHITTSAGLWSDFFAGILQWARLERRPADIGVMLHITSMHYPICCNACAAETVLLIVVLLAFVLRIGIVVCVPRSKNTMIFDIWDINYIEMRQKFSLNTCLVSMTWRLSLLLSILRFAYMWKTSLLVSLCTNSVTQCSPINCLASKSSVASIGPINVVTSWSCEIDRHAFSLQWNVSHAICFAWSLFFNDNGRLTINCAVRVVSPCWQLFQLKITTSRNRKQNAYIIVMSTCQ